MIISEKLMQDLQSIINVQLSQPECKTDAYMCGLANGLLLAQAILLKKEANFLPRIDNDNQ